MKYDQAIAQMGGMTPHRRKLHMGAEALAVFAIGPLLIATGLTKNRISPGAKRGLVALGVGTIVLDGYLLSKWKKQKSDEGG